MKNKSRDTVITLLSCTWGIAQTLAGLAVLLRYIRKPHYFRNGIVYTPWEDGGVSLGLFVFSKEMTKEELEREAPPDAGTRQNPGSMPDAGTRQNPGSMPDVGTHRNRGASEERSGYELFCHELGHTRQSAILGPLYLPLIGLPSLLWNRLPVFERLRKKKQLSYYSFFTERWADRLGRLRT